MDASNIRSGKSRKLLEMWRTESAMDARVFRELITRAEPICWIALIRSIPITSAPPAKPSCSIQHSNDAPKYQIGLVDPRSRRMDLVQRTRGGPRVWSSAACAVRFVFDTMRSTPRVLEVHVV